MLTLECFSLADSYYKKINGVAMGIKMGPSFPGGGGYLTKFNTGRLRPEPQPPTLLYTILAEKVSLLYTFY